VIVDGPDRFEDAYAAGVLDDAPSATTPEGRREIAPRLAPTQGCALRGCVLGPREVIDDGYVVIGPTRRIEAVQTKRPEGVPVLETDGVVMPGLIDLHGHPEFNVFAAWEPPKLFANRYRWRGSELYKALVREPQNRLLGALAPGTQLRYAEIRALVGGVTAIQGASGKLSNAAESLVRNVDLRVFGAHRARAMIDLPSEGSRDLPRLQRILKQVDTGEVTALYVHLAEGRLDDARSMGEFDRLVELGALTPATVIIHGSALTRDQLGQVSDAGAKLVWSPQSNLRLYATTTRAADALDLGVTMGLGADWLPSGSTSLLAELKVARRVLARQGRPTAPEGLVRMVTADAAGIAGLSDQLGSLEVGRPADVVVLERRREDPFENVIEADPSWVELVSIDGDLAYGRADWIRELAAPDDVGRLEPVVAWGTEMLLDTAYAVAPTAGSPPTLADLRAALIAQYPQVGPIFG
jgi:5-methylthioadenosine/S-adenosylhomocysteine deaminase